MEERRLLSAIAFNREYFDSATRYVTVDDFGDQGKIVFREIQEYYANDPNAGGVDLGIVEGRLERKYPKHIDGFRIVLGSLEPISAPNVIREVCEVKKEAVGRQIASAVLAGEDISDLNAQYSRYLAGELTEDSESRVFAGHAVEDIFEYASGNNTFRLYPNSLNTAVGGGAGRGDYIVIYGLPECYDDTTEVLTDRGWSTFKDLDRGARVAQVNDDLSVEFVTPVEYIDKPTKTRDMVRFYNKSGSIDIRVTENHSMYHTIGGAWHREGAKEALPYQGKKYHRMARASEYVGEQHLTPVDRFCIAYQADGSGARRGCTGERGHFTVRFGLVKDRKKKRLEGILRDMGATYTTKLEPRGNGYVTYYVQVSQHPLKMFDKNWFIGKSRTWCQEAIEEIVLWDGHSRSNSLYKYDTVAEENAKVVQTIAAMAGYSTKFSVYKDARKDTYKDVYTVNINKTYVPLDGQNIFKETVTYTGTVHCVQVPSGKLLVRSNGQLLVCGNSGKTMLSLNMACGFARDGHKVLMCGNEDRWSRMLERVICRMTGLPKREVKRDYAAAERVAYDKGYGNFVFAEMSPGTFYDIDMLLDQHQPDILMVDQIRKLYVQGCKGETEQLTRASDYMRRTAKRREILTIGITQAGDSASGKLILDMGDIYMNHTSVAGDADLMIGWGVNDEYERVGRRMVSVIKNKLNGYHGSFPVAVDTQISKVTSL